MDEGVEMTSVKLAAVRFLENDDIPDGGFELLRKEKVLVRSEDDPEEMGEIIWIGEEEVVRISDPFEVGIRPTLAWSQLNKASPPICARPIVAASPVVMLSRSNNSVPRVFVKS